jgi:hypothetical protein
MYRISDEIPASSSLVLTCHGLLIASLFSSSSLLSFLAPGYLSIGCRHLLWLSLNFSAPPLHRPNIFFVFVYF